MRAISTSPTRKRETSLPTSDQRQRSPAFPSALTGSSSHPRKTKGRQAPWPAENCQVLKDRADPQGQAFGGAPRPCTRICRDASKAKGLHTGASREAWKRKCNLPKAEGITFQRNSQGGGEMVHTNTLLDSHRNLKKPGTLFFFFNNLKKDQHLWR